MKLLSPFGPCSCRPDIDVAGKSPDVGAGGGSGFWSQLLYLQLVPLGTSDLPAETPGVSFLQLKN